MPNDPKATIEGDIVAIITKEAELATLESQLQQNEQFRSFIALKKEVDTASALLWKVVEDGMIANDIKSIKGDWGSVTIAERIGFDTTEELPAKFYKKVVDTKKLADTFKLEGRPIKGATVKYTKYLTKRLK